jgi:hypothetical protein
VKDYEVVKLLTDLGCHSIRIRVNNWVASSCPFARWKHPGGTDKKPSFAIKVNAEGKSLYRCLSCGASGDMLSFAWAYQRVSGRDIKELFTWLQKTNIASPSAILAKLQRATYDRPKNVEIGGIRVSTVMLNESPETIEQSILPESELDRFSELSGEGLRYVLEARRMTHEMIREWEILWHPRARRVSIPIRNLKGDLVGISGRAISSSQSPKYLHSKGFRRDLYLYGEHKAIPNKPCYLVEGNFDVSRLWSYGYKNSVAIFGSYLSKFQVMKIKELFTEVIIVPDGDKPGFEAASRALSVLPVPTRIVSTPIGLDPDNFSYEQAVNLLGKPLT